MTTVQFEKIFIEYTRDMPKEMLMEVIDFIRFLREKKLNKLSNNLTEELTKLSHSQIKHIEKEFTNYKQLYPIE
ncbi:MAG: DUF2281 domain-containing protein [Bacteroidota bacterium]